MNSILEQKTDTTSESVAYLGHPLGSKAFITKKNWDPGRGVCTGAFPILWVARCQFARLSNTCKKYLSFVLEGYFHWTKAFQYPYLSNVQLTLVNIILGEPKLNCLSPTKSLTRAVASANKNFRNFETEEMWEELFGFSISLSISFPLPHSLSIFSSFSLSLYIFS